MNQPYLSLAEARASGAPRYFTGKPCKRGNVAERRTSTRQCLCDECSGLRRQEKREWRAANLEHCREQNRLWHAQDRPRSRKLARDWHNANIERCRENARRWRAKNKGWVKERHRQWAAANPEYMAKKARKWRAENRDKWRSIMRAAIMKRRRAVKKTVLTPQESRQITAIYLLRRTLSKATGTEFHVDHHIPLSKGGLHHPSNLWVILAGENLRKAASLPTATPTAPAYRQRQQCPAG